MPAAPVASQSPWGLGAAFLTWGASVGLLFFLQLAAIIPYFAFSWLIKGERPSGEITVGVALITLGATLVAHVLTLVVCWWVVTGRGQRAFLATLGWRWHAQFKMVHALALAVLMYLLAGLFEKILPHGETDFERLLKLGPAVRVAIAFLAVFTAPLVEEVVYRGALYSALARARGWVMSTIIVTLLFAVVHVPQYWKSPAAIAAILSLSLVLTLLRAATGQILPCVVTHTIFNGVQAVLLLITRGEAPEPVTPAAALSFIGHWLGPG
jgi:membrane protease YdiL (CAAX protease family)